MPALAYFLTFSAYGTRLPGSEKGWVDAQHSAYGSPSLPGNHRRNAYWEAHLNESPWILHSEARRITLEALISVCGYRGWTAHALHIRTTHVHGVVAAETTPERMLSNFKAYATRALRRFLTHDRRRRYWTHHGSTRYLWTNASVIAAVDYVLNGQGEKMECYPNGWV